MAKTITRLKTEGYDVKISANDYHSAEGNITTGNNQQIDLNSLDTITSIEILNDTANKDLSISINGGSNFTVKGSESKTIENIIVTNLLLTNGSDSTINYRVLAWGF